MKILKDSKLYIQKIDLDYIFTNYDNSQIPLEILNYKNIEVSNSTDFILINETKSIQFINNTHIFSLDDYKEMNFLELYGIKENLFYEIIEECKKNNINLALVDNYADYIEETDPLVNYLKKTNEINHYILDFAINNKENYPIETQDLIYKYQNINLCIRMLNNEIVIINNKNEELYKTYSKKQLRKIYYEVLAEELSYEELKPIEKQLKTIFQTMDYTPDIRMVITYLERLKQNNYIDFIDDTFMKTMLKLLGYKNKFEVSCITDILDIIYAIGYQYLILNSNIMFEKDLERIQNFFIISNHLKKDDLKLISFYNPILFEVAIILKDNIKNMNISNRLFNDVIINMCVYYYIEYYRYDINIFKKALNEIINNFDVYFIYIKNYQNSKDNLNHSFKYMFNICAHLLKKTMEEFINNNNNANIKKLEKNI